MTVGEYGIGSSAMPGVNCIKSKASIGCRTTWFATHFTDVPQNRWTTGIAKPWDGRVETVGVIP